MKMNTLRRNLVPVLCNKILNLEKKKKELIYIPNSIEIKIYLFFKNTINMQL